MSVLFREEQFQGVILVCVFIGSRLELAILQIMNKDKDDDITEIMRSMSFEEDRLTPQHHWLVIDAYLKERGLVHQQIASYHQFLTDVRNLLINQGKLEITIQPQFKPGEKVRNKEVWCFQFKEPINAEKPVHQNQDGSEVEVNPMECRLRDLNYSASLKANLQISKYVEKDGKLKEVNSFIYQQLQVCKLPVMVGSKLCHTWQMKQEQLMENEECVYEKGGYFICQGLEKVIVGSQRKIENFIHVIKKDQKKEPWLCEIRSKGLTGRLAPDLLQVALKVDKLDTRIICRCKYITKDLEIGLFFKALGLKTDQDLYQSMCDAKLLNMSEDALLRAKNLSDVMKQCLDQPVFQTQRECLFFIGHFVSFNKDSQDEESCIEACKQFLTKYFLPHLGTTVESFQKKGEFLGYMCQKLIQAYIQNNNENDWQHLGKRRIDLSGHLLSKLFEGTFKKSYLPHARNLLMKMVSDGEKIEKKIKLIFDQRIMSRSIVHAFATGVWGNSANQDRILTGVTQVLKRETNHLATLSHLRKIATPYNASRHDTAQRLLHNTHWGMLCPSQTPDGQKIGLVKHLALMVQITNKLTAKQNDEISRVVLRSKWLQKSSKAAQKQKLRKTKIFMNGNWMANTCQPIQFVQEFRQLRRSGALNYQISITCTQNNTQIQIYTDSGRCMRPLLVVENNQIKLKSKHLSKSHSIEQLLKNGLIQFLDVEEEETSLIAFDCNDLQQNRNYTHCELHPSLIFGVCASFIPYSNHNQATKNTLASAMSKQTIGIQSTNSSARMDALNYQLYYHQKPLASTRTSKNISVNELPTGLNAIVATSIFTGYNQQDSIIINQSAIERGLFRSALYRTYKAEQNVGGYGSNQLSIIKPTMVQKMKIKSDDVLLDNDGLPFVGELCEDGNAVIGQVARHTARESNNTFERETQRMDLSIRIKRGERGYIEAVVIAENSKGLKTAKVKTRTVKIPQIGDKFASRHGQKGVCGMTFRQQDLPFTIEGIIPDMIINPHCIPSRMTVGHVLECFVSKCVAVKGTKQHDATSFEQVDEKKIQEELHSCGYLKNGSEFMIDPYSGIQNQRATFVGPIYYHRLRHLVEDKVYSRQRGLISALTRQPTKGRSKDGGLRIGEMEKDCLLSHGLTEFLKERLFKVSDDFKMVVCKNCGFLVNLAKDMRADCRRCRKESRVCEVSIPYSTKLMMQELTSMMIVPRLCFASGQ